VSTYLGNLQANKTWWPCKRAWLHSRFRPILQSHFWHIYSSSQYCWALRWCHTSHCG